MSSENKDTNSFKHNVHVASSVDMDTKIPKNAKPKALPVIDGYQTKDGDRILLLNQTNNLQNGIYIVKSGYLYLSSDSDNADAYVNGASVRVMNGDTNGYTEWYIAPISQKDFKTAPKLFISSPFGTIANIQKNDIVDITVPNGLTYITFGPEPVSGSITTEGTGDYVNITGNENEIMRYDSAGYPGTSTSKLHNGLREGSMFLQSFTTDPTGAQNGDWWFEENAGTTYMCRKNSLGVVQKTQLL